MVSTIAIASPHSTLQSILEAKQQALATMVWSSRLNSEDLIISEQKGLVVFIQVPFPKWTALVQVTTRWSMIRTWEFSAEVAQRANMNYSCTQENLCEPPNKLTP